MARCKSSHGKAGRPAGAKDKAKRKARSSGASLISDHGMTTPTKHRRAAAPQLISDHGETHATGGCRHTIGRPTGAKDKTKRKRKTK